jgi:chaperonin GroEL (HSP60 family)
MTRLENNNNSTKGVLEGIRKASDIITSTMGGSGKNILMFEKKLLQWTKDGVSVAKKIQFKDPEEDAGAQMLITAANKTVRECGDGPQPLYSKILTPNGWTTMGEVKEGDVICSTDGRFQTIEEVFEKGEREIYEVKFMDGRIVECCEDHLWTVFTNSGKQLTTTTKKLIESNKIYLKRGLGVSQYGYYVPIAEVDFQEKELPIDPYLLGLILGDGSISTKTIKITLALHEGFILEKLPVGLKHSVSTNLKKNCLNITLNGKEIRDKLIGLGLFGKKSDSKFIPDLYLYNSKDNRKKLLDGLLDSDGHLNKRGRFEYSTVSENLYKGFCELTRGLGYSLYSKIHSRNSDPDSYSQVPIYRIRQLKGYTNGNKIVSILPTGVKTQMRCIKVSSENNLYVTDNYIVTHNTTLTSLFVQEFVSKLFKLCEERPVNDVLEEWEGNINLVVEELQKRSQKIENVEQIYNIALTSCKNEALAKLIHEIYRKVGLKASISVQLSEHSPASYYEVTKGLNFDGGLIHPLFANQLNGTYQAEKPYIWLTEEIMNDFEGNAEVINDFHENKIPLIIIAKDFSDSFIRYTLTNKQSKNLDICLLKLPGWGAGVRENVRDMKSFITRDRVNKITVTPTDFTLYNNPDSKKVRTRIKQLEAQQEGFTEEFDINDFARRIDTLNQTSAIIYVGGRTFANAQEEFDRIEDAVGACRTACRGGYIKGAGAELQDIADKFQMPFQDVLLAPQYKIFTNANLPMKLFSNIPFNVKTKQPDPNLLDPTNVVITALLNSFALATLLINTSYILHD